MSTELAQQWLNNHSPVIPALNENHQQILELIERKNQPKELNKIAIRDPGLALALLCKVNASRGPKSGRDVVESPQAAISLLGDKMAYQLFESHPVAEHMLSDETAIYLFQQLMERACHNETQAESWALANGYPLIEQLKITALLAYLGETLCCVHDYKAYVDYLKKGATVEAAQQVFSFSFDELTLVVCQALHLPEFFTRALASSQDPGQRARLMGFSSTLCQQCENGWYSQDMVKTYEAFAEFLQMPLDKVITKTHEFAILAARQSYIQQAWHPASRLLLIEDRHWINSLQKPAPKTVAEKTAAPEPVEEKAADTQSEIRRLVKLPETTQSQLLNICIKGLYKDLQLSKVCLLMLSQDKTSIQNRMAIGIEDTAPFRSYRIDVQKAGLLKILLNKPQAVWINNDSYKKYQQLIPQSFMASIMTNQFVAMSLFVGDKPIGVIYADRTDSTQPVDQALFTQFKQLISLTSKALTLLAKR